MGGGKRESYSVFIVEKVEIVMSVQESAVCVW